MSGVFEELERFVPKEHKDEYRKFVAYTVQYKPTDEIGQICYAAGWLAMITRETPDAFAKNADAFLASWKKEQTQLLSAVATFKDDHVRLSSQQEELKTLIDKANKSIATLFTGFISQTGVVIREATMYETMVRRACTDLKQTVDCARADLQLATTTAMERTRKKVEDYCSSASWIVLSTILLDTGIADLAYPDTGIYVCILGVCSFVMGILQHYLRER